MDHIIRKLLLLVRDRQLQFSCADLFSFIEHFSFFQLIVIFIKMIENIANRRDDV